MQPHFYTTPTGHTVPAAILAARTYELYVLRTGSIPQVALSGGGGNGNGGDKKLTPTVLRGWMQ